MEEISIGMLNVGTARHDDERREQIVLAGKPDASIHELGNSSMLSGLASCYCDRKVTKYCKKRLKNPKCWIVES